MTEQPTPETDDRLKIDRRTMLKGGAAGLGLLALGGMGAGSAVASNGADKIYVGGSALEEQVVETKDGSKTKTFDLLTGSIKTSTPTDLILMVQVESALWTDIKTTGKDESSQATAGVTCWVEIDGEAVPVSVNDMNDYGLTRQEASEIVFNKRDFRVQQNFLKAIDDIYADLYGEDLESYLALYLNTRSSNGFNWVALNLDSDYVAADRVHDIVLKGRVDVFADDSNATAKAVFGPRTMIGFPAKLANDASI